MEWTIKKEELREFNELFAIENDMYWYHDGKLIYICNSIEDSGKQSLLKKIKTFLWRKRKGNMVALNRRTLEYIYNVCKGVMPETKEQFVECVMRTIPHGLTNQ